MIKRKLTVIWVLLLHTITLSNAQSGLVIAGSDFSGAGGTVSFSAGLVDYITSSGVSGSMAEGLQHPVELFPAAMHEQEYANFQITAGPNPAIHEIFLFIETTGFSGFRYTIHVPGGETILSKRITGKKSTIPVVSWPAGVYLLDVTHHGVMLRSFKIIKP